MNGGGWSDGFQDEAHSSLVSRLARREGQRKGFVTLGAYAQRVRERDRLRRVGFRQRAGRGGGIGRSAHATGTGSRATFAVRLAQTRRRSDGRRDRSRFSSHRGRRTGVAALYGVGRAGGAALLRPRD